MENRQLVQDSAEAIMTDGLSKLTTYYDAIQLGAYNLTSITPGGILSINDNDNVVPVLEVALHLSKQDEQPPPLDKPNYYIV